MIATTLQILISVGGLILGVVYYLHPMETIERQKQFYARINWRVEPISMPREIRNTKLMGLFLLIAIIVIWISRL